MDTPLPTQLHSCLAPNSVQFPYFCKVSQFTSIGTGNGQGNRHCRYWCYKNPHAVHDGPVHDHKLEPGVQWANAKSESLCFVKENWSSCEQFTFFAKVKDSIQRETANISRKEVCHMSRHIFSRFKAYSGGGQYLWDSSMKWRKLNGMGKLESKFMEDTVTAATLRDTTIRPSLGHRLLMYCLPILFHMLL